MSTRASVVHRLDDRHGEAGPSGSLRRVGRVVDLAHDRSRPWPAPRRCRRARRRSRVGGAGSTGPTTRCRARRRGSRARARPRTPGRPPWASGRSPATADGWRAARSRSAGRCATATRRRRVGDQLGGQPATLLDEPPRQHVERSAASPSWRAAYAGRVGTWGRAGERSCARRSPMTPQASSTGSERRSVDASRRSSSSANRRGSARSSRTEPRAVPVPEPEMLGERLVVRPGHLEHGRPGRRRDRDGHRAGPPADLPPGTSDQSPMRSVSRPGKVPQPVRVR